MCFADRSVLAEVADNLEQKAKLLIPIDKFMSASCADLASIIKEYLERDDGKQPCPHFEPEYFCSLEAGIKP